MKNNKLFIFILSLMLIIAGIFISCESDAPDPGTVNQGLYPFFKIDDNGKLVIVSGAGIKNLVIPGTVQTSSGNKQVIFDGFVSADDKNALESVTVGAGVQGIGDGAFSGAGNLSNVTFEKGSSLESIGSGAFQGTGITGIDIPSSVTTIDNNAFADTPKLESVGLGANITTQGDASNIFGDNVKHVTIKGDGKGNETVGNMFSGKDKLESVTITEGVTTINSGAFQNDSSLSKVELPSTLTTIGDNAFTSISPEASITLPYATTNVANSAFDQATTLYRTLRFFQMKDSSVYRDATVKIQPAPVAIDSFLIEKAVEFKSVLAPQPNFALDAILDYSSSTIYASATEDGSLATTVNITDLFPQGAHSNDIILSWLDGNVKYNPVYGEDGTITGYTVSLNNPLTPADTKEVSILPTHKGKPVVSIGDNAFANTDVKVNFPASAEDYKITAIGDNAFKGNTSLTEDILAKLPLVTTVGEGAFSNTGLTEATIPGGLTEIPASVFEGSSNLSTLKPVNALDGVTSIGDKAFAGTALTGNPLEGNNSITTIGNGAFSGTDITEITLPKSVTEITGAFTGTSPDLKKVSVASDTTLTLDEFLSAFDKPSSVTELDIPLSFIDTDDEAKKLAEYFPNAVNIVAKQTAPATKEIGKLSPNFDKLTSITLPEGITSIPAGAFENLNIAGDFNIPSTVTEMGEGAFAGTDITSVNIPKDLKDDAIPPRAFENCGSLSKLNPDNALDGIISIGDKAFAGTGLTELTIPESVKDIGTGAFAGMNNLNKVVIDNNINLGGENPFNEFISAFDKPSSVTELTIPPSLWPDTDKEWIEFNEVFKNVETLIVPDQTGTSTDNVIGPLSNIDFNDLQKVDIGSGVILLPGTPGTANPPRIDEIEITTDTLGEGNNPFAGVEIGKVTINPGEGDKTIITTGTGNGIILDNAGDIVIGDGITVIQQGGLTGMGPDNKVHTITLPDSVTTVAAGAFDDEDIIIFNAKFTDYYNNSDYYVAPKNESNQPFTYTFNGSDIKETPTLVNNTQISGCDIPVRYGYTQSVNYTETMYIIQLIESRTIALDWAPMTYKLAFNPVDVNTRAVFNSPEVTVTFDPTDTEILTDIKNKNPNYGYDFNEIASVEGLVFGQNLETDLTPHVEGGKITLDVTRIAEKYTIKLMSNGSEFGEITVTFGGTFEELELKSPTRDGYTFKRWVNGETEYTSSTKVENPISTGFTLTAEWTPNTYTVNFNGNGSDGGTAMTSQRFTYDVAQNLTTNTYERTGYTFAGWSDKADGTGKDYADAVSVKNIATSGEITLYAQWSPIGYGVGFDSNGGTSGSMTGLILSYDGEITLPENTYKKTGHTFVGWNTKADGTGTSYGDKATVKNLTSTSGSLVTLYAQWKADTWTLNFEAKTGGFDTWSITVTYGEPFLSVDNIKDGINKKTDNVSGNETNFNLDVPVSFVANGKTVQFNNNDLTVDLGEDGEAFNIKVTRSVTITINNLPGFGGTLDDTSWQEQKVVEGNKVTEWKYTTSIDYNGTLTLPGYKYVTTAFTGSNSSELNTRFPVEWYKFNGYKDTSNKTTYESGKSLSNIQDDVTLSIDGSYIVHFNDETGNKIKEDLLIDYGTSANAGLPDLREKYTSYHWRFKPAYRAATEVTYGYTKKDDGTLEKTAEIVAVPGTFYLVINAGWAQNPPSKPNA